MFGFVICLLFFHAVEQQNTHGPISINSIKSRLISYDQRFYLSLGFVESCIFPPMHYSI